MSSLSIKVLCPAFKVGSKGDKSSWDQHCRGHVANPNNAQKIGQFIHFGLKFDPHPKWVPTTSDPCITGIFWNLLPIMIPKLKCTPPKKLTNISPEKWKFIDGWWWLPQMFAFPLYKKHECPFFVSTRTQRLFSGGLGVTFFHRCRTCTPEAKGADAGGDRRCTF